MSKTDQKESKLEVALPAHGYRKIMYFNRYHIEHEDEFSVVQFGLLSVSGVLDSYNCLLSKEALAQNKEGLITYLKQSGSALSPAQRWKGIAIAGDVHNVDIVTMSFRGGTAETCLFCFSMSAAGGMRRESSNEPLRSNALALLRSTSELQRSFIEEMYG